MKLLIYSHEFPPFQGGLATASIKLDQSLAERKFDVTALVPSYGRIDHTVDDSLQATVRRIPLLGRRFVKKIPLLQYFLGWVWFQFALISDKPRIVIFVSEEAEAIISLLSNKELSLKMGRYGRDMVREKFSEKRMINQFVEILISTVSS